MICASKLGQYKGLTIHLSPLLNKDDKKIKIEHILSAILENSEFICDENQIDKQVKDKINYFKNQLAMSGITLKKYLKDSSKTYKEFFEELKVITKESMKKDWVQTALVQAEGIGITEEDMTNKIEDFAKIAGKTYDEMMDTIRQYGQLSTVYKELLWDKISEFLLKNNTVLYDKES